MAANRPINIASPEFLRQLDAIEPGVWGTPCSIVLLDGRSFEFCLAWENPRFGDAGKWINPNCVGYLTECPKRMPAKFARSIKNAGESGMGYHIYVVRLSDGNNFVHVAGNLAIDLVDLPSGYTQRDIVGVDPHEGRERSRTEGYRRVSGHGASVEFARPLGKADCP
ncbi:MAG: hypothetical protein ABSD28_17785 [Tepidisphaeraceae bacterium]|jgi:hypothetical protein